MIYSPQFQALPEAPKNLVMGRINDVLSGKIAGPKYAHLTPGVCGGDSRNPASDPKFLIFNF